MKAELKRDSKGRFTVKAGKKPDAKKVDVQLHFERPEGLSDAEYIKCLEKECETLKLTSERYMSQYLNDRVAVKKGEKHLDQYLFAMDAMREAYMQIGWYYHHLPWITRLVYRKKIAYLNKVLDDMVAKAELLDRE